MAFTKQEVTESLRRFKSLRDNLLHEEDLSDHLHAILRFCQNDAFVQSVLAPHLGSRQIDVQAWLQGLKTENGWVRRLEFPDDPAEAMVLRYSVLQLADEDSDFISRLGMMLGKRKRDEWEEAFKGRIVRPCLVELSERMGEAANLATPEARALQAVPLARIPGEKEVRIFLSHKTVDKPLVYRYYSALKEVGFDPWLDEQAMPVGTNLERGIYQAFVESCAAVFFITDSFKDEKFLAAEVDYAIAQKREKGARFAIITLRYSDAAPVPGLLTPYIYRTVSNDLEGFRELIRALPVELGPVRWKENVVE